MESTTNSNSFLGRLVPAKNFNSSVLDVSVSNLIKKYLLSKSNPTIEVYVASANNLKVSATEFGIKKWLKALIGTKFNLSIKGYDTASGIDEQPHGEEITKRGAINRLSNLYFILQKEAIDVKKPDTLFILVALENGLISEPYESDIDSFIFRQSNKNVWIDRCVCSCDILFGNERFNTLTFSEGVTTPFNQVIASQSSGWAKTAGSFISEKYGLNAKDWHAGICGKSRQAIMEELILTLLGFRSAYANIPVKESLFRPEVFHHYNNESIDFFVPSDIDGLLTPDSLNSTQSEDLAMWREMYSQIPQLNKPGADGISSPNSLGPILTEDLMATYFDHNDVLHVVLVWPKLESTDLGWCLPGKRDRAYDTKNGDISVKDANFSLVEKEIGVPRSNVIFHTILGYFDDRKRELRMKSSGFVSFVLLKDIPTLIPGKRIGIPINAFISLAKREIKIPDWVGSGNSFGLSKNHDSLILSLMSTTKFNSVMEKIKLNQLKYRADLIQAKDRTKVKRPPFSGIDANYECGVCMDILVGAKIICSEGHTVCGECTSILKQKGICPFCRGVMLPKPIDNRHVDALIKEHYPELYETRYKELFDVGPTSWRDEPMFNGTTIQYSN